MQSFTFPLSTGQQQVWFLQQVHPDVPIYNLPMAFQIEGPLDYMTLKDALQEIVRRHETLRTSFQMNEGQPVQVIAPSITLELPRYSLNKVPAESKESEAYRQLLLFARHPFDLNHAPLLRTALWQLDEQRYLFAVTVHHIIFDDWSRGIFFDELRQLYTAFHRGRPSPLPELEFQYVDFAHWQRKRWQDEQLTEARTYWKEQLAGVPEVLDLPSDYPRPVEQSYRGALWHFSLPSALSQSLERLSRSEGCTLFMSLLAAFQTLLWRYSNQEHFVVGSPIAGRTRLEVEPLIGFFANTLALRADLSDNPNFIQLLQRVRDVTIASYTYQEIPFEKEGQPQQEALFQAWFDFQNTAGTTLKLDGLSVQPIRIDNGTTKFDLALTLEMGQTITGAFEYNTDLFTEATIQHITGHFHKLLEGIVADPALPLAFLPLLTETECQQVLVDWNRTSVPDTGQTFLDSLFEEQVEKRPGAVAIVCEDQQISYRELNEQANQLAHYLRTLGVGPEVCVGLCMERSIELIIGIVGILKAGGAYVPLEPTHPPARLLYQLEASQASLLLTRQSEQPSIPDWSERQVCLEQFADTLSKQPRSNPERLKHPQNLAYVIYTSGSTGTPKGVMVQHQSIVNYIRQISRELSVEPGWQFAMISTLAADLGNTAIFVSLATGGCLHILPHSTVTDGQAFAQYVAGRPLDVLKIVPSHLSALLAASADQAILPRRALVLGGERCTWQLVRQISQAKDAGDKAACRIFNHYGPTETTIGTVFSSIGTLRQVQETASETEQRKGDVLLGRPLGNTQAYVLDRYLHPVPIGVVGELYISGAGLARGYLARPGLTAERFVPDPFGQEPGQRLYRTGDQVRYLSNGNLEFRGRLDTQVKVRGYRIEPGEIEAICRLHPIVQDVVVLAREDELGNQLLIAYLVANPVLSPSTETLEDHLHARLPAYMIPSTLTFIGAMPLTANGKIDRDQLRMLKPSEQGPVASYVAPRTPVEEVLASFWAQILGLERVGIHDNFFEMGGDSLRSLRVIAKANQIGLRFTMRQLFRYPTIADLMSNLQEEPAGAQRIAALNESLLKFEGGNSQRRDQTA